MAVKDNWQYNEVVTEQDMNQIGQAINKNTDDIGDMSTVPTQAKDAAGAITEVNQTLDTHIADSVSHVHYAPDTGTANAKVVTFDPAPAAYVEGMAIAFKNKTQNTGAVTINVNGLGPKSVLKSSGSALTSGSLKANSIYTLRYNGTAFILQGEGSDERTGHVTGQSISRSGTTLRIRPQAGDYPGDPNNSVQWSDPNWIAENIRAGRSIFGLSGTLELGKKFASGSVTTSNTKIRFTQGGTLNPGTNDEYYVQLPNINFDPRMIVVLDTDGFWQTIYSRDAQRFMYPLTPTTNWSSVLYFLVNNKYTLPAFSSDKQVNWIAYE